MLSYIIRRLLLGIPTVLGVLLILFILFFWVAKPEFIAKKALGGDKAPPEQIEAWIKAHGYDLPKFYNPEAGGMQRFSQTRIFQYYADMLSFKFGNSDLDDIPIQYKIRKGMGPSLTLTVPVFVVGLFISIGVSLLVALFRGTYVDKSVLVLCVIGMSVVYFLYIIGGQYYLGKVLRWFPISGWSSRHMVHFLTMPWLVGIVAGIGSSVRFYRTIMVNEINSDYVRTARAKGASDTALLFVHVLKNAMIPILTGVVMAIPFLFTGSLLLESFFGIPGLGRLTVEAITNNDFRTISTMVFISALLYIFANLMTDISYTMVDPRVRLN
jgi:peptide/nickel transport system permease protein